MCVTDRHDMNLAVEVALNPNRAYQLNCVKNFHHQLVTVETETNDDLSRNRFGLTK